MHREMLALQLERLQLIDRQIAKLNALIAQAMKPHQEAVMRLAEVPGLGVDSAQHEEMRFIEHGVDPDPKAKNKRARMLARALRKLGYEVTITPINLNIAENGMHKFSEEFSRECLQMSLNRPILGTN